MEVLKEQEEFQKFVYHHAKANHHLYNFIHPDVWDSFKVHIIISNLLNSKVQ